MEEQSLLIGLSQLGIVYAGLISVFIIFAAKDGVFSPPERQHVRGLIMTSFPVVIGSLLPFAFHLYGASELIIWRGTSAIFLIFGTIISAENFAHYLRMSRSDKKINGYFHAIFSFGLNAVVAILLGAAALGYAPKANYIVSILVVLLIGMSSFVTFAFQRFLKNIS